MKISDDNLTRRRFDRIVLEAYEWLSENYDPSKGDRIFLFGMSLLLSLLYRTLSPIDTDCAIYDQDFPAARIKCELGRVFGLKAGDVLKDVELHLQGLGKEVINIDMRERTGDDTAPLS